MARPNPQFNTPLGANSINAELPLYPIYGVTPDNKYTPISVDENGQLAIGNVTITGPVTVNDVVIKGVDPANSFTSEDVSVVNWGINGYALRTSLFYQGNVLMINSDGSANVSIVGPIDISIDHNLDSIAIYGTDGTSDQFIKTNSSGNLLIDVVSTVLPPNAAQETGGNLATINAGLETLNSLIPSVYDYIDLSYTGSNLTTTVFKLGGSFGTVVSTLILTYDGGGNLLTVTKN